MRLSYLVQRGDLYYFQCRVPCRPFFPLDSIHPRLTPESNSQKKEGQSKGSWCCWPTLQQLHLVLVKDTGRHDKGDCVQ